MISPGKATEPGTHSEKKEAPNPEISTQWLFKDAKTLAIMHAGDRYLLRITRQNKLILTK